MLGHADSPDSPAYVSMLFAINADSYMAGRLGRPCLNLLDVIRKDLIHRNLKNNLRNVTDFEDLRFLALDRRESEARIYRGVYKTAIFAISRDKPRFLSFPAIDRDFDHFPRQTAIL